ncbi:MAG: LysR family transcriptional regulator [Myxococcota bacterium]
MVLDALLDTESVKAASARVALSPSATSHALARLRELLDDPLLVRAGARMVLTPRGARLRPRVRAALDALRNALTPEVEVEPELIDRRFRIATNDYGELCVLSVLSQQLSRQAPKIDYGVVPAPDLLEALRRSDVDLAIGVFREQAEDLVSVPLWRDKFVCVVRGDHPIARRRKLSLKSFLELDHMLVAPRGQPRGVVDEKLAAMGLRRRVTRTASSFLVAPYYVASSDLVLTVSSRIAHRIAEPLGLKVYTPPLELEGFLIRLLWHRAANEDGEHRWFRERLASLMSLKEARV